MIFVFIPKVFATNYMSLDKTSVQVGDTFALTVQFENATAWNISAYAQNAQLLKNCVIYENGSSSEEAENKTFSVNCKALAEGSTSIVLEGEITFGSDTENPVTVNESIDLTINPQPVPKGLASLTVTGGTLSPTFDSINTGYTITLNSVDTSSFSLNATANTSSDDVKVEREAGGSYETVTPSNIAFVTAGNNDVMLIRISVGSGERLVVYEITVDRPKAPSVGDPELATLTINGLDIPLTSGKYEYDLYVDENVTSYALNATLKDPVNYKFDDYLVPPFEISSKEIPIKIVPKDETTGLKSQNYVIRIKTTVIDPETQPKTTTKSSGYIPSGNPQTGGASVYIVGFMLVASFAISIYLYKKNMSGYN